MKTALIIGAGPAGLTAGLELIKKTDIKPIILESANDTESTLEGIASFQNQKRLWIGGLM